MGQLREKESAIERGVEERRKTYKEWVRLTRETEEEERDIRKRVEEMERGERKSLRHFRGKGDKKTVSVSETGRMSVFMRIIKMKKLAMRSRVQTHMMHIDNE